MHKLILFLETSLVDQHVFNKLCVLAQINANRRKLVMSQYEVGSGDLLTYSRTANEAASATVICCPQNILLGRQIEKNGVVSGASAYLIVVMLFSFPSVDRRQPACRRIFPRLNNGVKVSRVTPDLQRGSHQKAFSKRPPSV